MKAGAGTLIPVEDWPPSFIGGPVSDDGTYGGRRLAWNYRSNVVRFALYNLGEECARVEFDWPSRLTAWQRQRLAEFVAQVRNSPTLARHIPPAVLRGLA